MKLYEINESLINKFDAETGEILNDVQLEELEQMKQEKLVEIGLWIKNMKADADEFKTEIENMTARKKTLENKIANISHFLQVSLNGKKINEPKIQISYRKSQALQVIDESLVPQEYIKTVEVKSVDKMAIKEKIKAGEVIPGVAIEEKQNMIIK